MKQTTHYSRIIISMMGSLLLLALVASAAENPPAPTPPAATALATPAVSPAAELPKRQEQVAEKFRELEKVLIRMAELTAPTDPRRAALLRQAVAQSKDLDIDARFDKLIELLKQERLSAVLKGQGEVHQDLVRLLDLLLSEDRGKRIEDEKKRYQAILKEVNEFIKRQKILQADTIGEGEQKRLAKDQGDLAQRTGDLADEVKKDSPKQSPDGDSGKPSPGSDQKSGGEKSPDKSKSPDADKNKAPEKSPVDKDKDKNPSPDKGPEAGKSAGGDPSKQDGANGEKPSDKSQGGESQQGKPSQGKPMGQGQPQGDAQPGESGDPPNQQSQDESPVQKRLKQAQKRMQEAQRKLEEARRRDASDKQAEAIRELQQAAAELEAILRQLREEEIARTLAMLEARFRRMLDMQLVVYEGTKRADHKPVTERDRDDEVEAGRLSRKEGEIAAEADRALVLLQEEGTSTAMPEAVRDMRIDMQQVVDRLAEGKVGKFTQGKQEDVIAALEEMIAALKKAQKDLEKKRNSQPGQAGEPGDPPLVDVLAEIKMIRALQMRINRATQRYTDMLPGEQADKPEIIAALKELSDRQARIHKVTREIVIGKNR